MMIHVKLQEAEQEVDKSAKTGLHVYSFLQQKNLIDQKQPERPSHWLNGRQILNLL